MDQIVFLQDLAIVMAVSAGILVLCQQFRMPVVLGYIVAGVVIGPNTPPYSLITDTHSIHILSDLGVIFLLFSIGLEFSLTKLLRVGLVSFFAASIEIFLMMWIGYLLGKAFGWNAMNSLFLGAILSISSTTIIGKVLMETKKIKEKFAQVILGILVIEDILAIVIIALLSGIAAVGSLELKEVGFSLLKVFSFIGGVLLLGFLAVPRLLKYIAGLKNSEMMVITVLGLCFGFSLLAAKFDFSVALGAFLIGAVIAETEQVKEIIHKIEPIRDMFTAIFFVSVGMLLSPQVVAQFWIPVLIITVVTILGKTFSCSLGTFLTGYPSSTALKVGLGLAQIGEFSFIIARLGESTGVTSPFLYPIAVSVSGITTLTTPLLMRSEAPIIHFLRRGMPKPIAKVLNLYTGWFQREIHERIEKAVGGIFSEEKEVHQELAKLIREEYPWEVRTEDFLLPYQESAVNQTIGDLRFRAETGATVVGIYRGQESIPNPPAATKLLPGDVLLLIGDSSQIKAAVQFLHRKMREPSISK